MKYKLGNVTIYVVVKDQNLSMVNLSLPQANPEKDICVHVYKLCVFSKNPQK